MLCWFLPSTAQISHNYPYIPFLPNHPPRVPSLQVIMEPQAGLHVLHRNFSPAIHLTPDSVYMLMPLSPFVPVSPSHTVSTSPICTAVSPSLPCK